MARGENQKLKLLYLLRMLEEKTDEEHSLTVPDMIEELAAYGINAERKSIYTDIEALRSFGADIIMEKKEKKTGYYLASREFELAELKLLVDAVQASRFITEKKSTQLIHKLENLTSHYDAATLQRQVFVANRIKNMNESIYYTVDAIHEAINRNKQIKFQYYTWNINKEMEVRKKGEYYEMSPWALLWSDENYYLIAYDSKERKIKHFRVDKMMKLDILRIAREGRELFEAFDLAEYARKMFGMFGGREERVRICFRNEMAGVVMDRFGKDTVFFPEDEAHFSVNVKVAVSRQFFAWILGLGEGVKIMSPQSVVDEMKKELENWLHQYE